MTKDLLYLRSVKQRQRKGIQYLRVSQLSIVGFCFCCCYFYYCCFVQVRCISLTLRFNIDKLCSGILTLRRVLPSFGQKLVTFFLFNLLVNRTNGWPVENILSKEGSIFSKVVKVWDHKRSMVLSFCGTLRRTISTLSSALKRNCLENARRKTHVATSLNNGQISIGSMSMLRYYQY